MPRIGMKNIPEPAQSGSARKCGANEERRQQRVFICGPTRCWELYQLRKTDVNPLPVKLDICSLVSLRRAGPEPRQRAKRLWWGGAERQRVFIRLQKWSCFSSAPRRIWTLKVPEQRVPLSIFRTGALTNLTLLCCVFLAFEWNTELKFWFVYFPVWVANFSLKSPRF